MAEVNLQLKCHVVMRFSSVMPLCGLLLCALWCLDADARNHPIEQRHAAPTDMHSITVAQAMQQLWPGDLNMPAISQHEHVALVSWHYQAKGQAAKHGRALWRKLDGKWQLISCAGKSLLDRTYLMRAGINPDTASALIKAHHSAEASLPQSDIELFDSFMSMHPTSHSDVHH